MSEEEFSRGCVVMVTMYGANIPTPSWEPDHWFCVSSQQRETLCAGDQHSTKGVQNRSDTFAVLVREGEGGGEV